MGQHQGIKQTENARILLLKRDIAPSPQSQIRFFIGTIDAIPTLGEAARSGLPCVEYHKRFPAVVDEDIFTIDVNSCRTPCHRSALLMDSATRCQSFPTLRTVLPRL